MWLARTVRHNTQRTIYVKVRDLEVLRLLKCYTMPTDTGTIAEPLSQGQAVEIRTLRNVGNYLPVVASYCSEDFNLRSH